MRDVGASEERVGQVTFGLVETEYFFFDGVLGDEVIDGDILLLPDAVGAVGGLLFDDGIPPRVEVDDIVGTGQVEPQSTGFETDEEEGAVARLEVADELLALGHRGRAIEIEVRQSSFVHGAAHFIEETGKLTEDEGTIATVVEAFGQIDEGEDFTAGMLPRFVDEGSTTRHAAEAGDVGEGAYFQNRSATNHSFFHRF